MLISTIGRIFSIGAGAILLLNATPAGAEAVSIIGDDSSEFQFSVDGAHRTRFENLLHDGSKGRLFALRTNLHPQLRYGNITLGGELMDSRAYSPDFAYPFGYPQNGQFNNTVEPIQYYLGAKFDNVFVDGLDVTLKGGRFTLDLGSGRHFGRNHFRNTVESFRGGQLLFERGDQSLLLFFVNPLQITNDGSLSRLSVIDGQPTVRFVGQRGQEMDSPNTDLDIFGAHYQRADAIGDVNAEAYLYVLKGPRAPVLPGAPATERLARYTTGVRIWRNPAPGAFDFEIEATPQFNQHPQGIGYYGHAEAGYSLNSALNARISFLFDIASGNGKFLPRQCTPMPPFYQSDCLSYPDQRGSARFTPLFGRLSDDFGPTGLYRANNPFGGGSRFGDVPGRSDIVSPAVRFEAALSGDFALQATARAFWREDPTQTVLTSPASIDVTSLSKNVGYQIDARSTFDFLDEHVQLEFGGAIFFWGDELDDLYAPLSPAASGITSRKYIYTSITVKM
ncbi:MAG: alginate export family protein [Parvularculaceae bacterium]|nr:alginate export family protein [Parvularculaceae bacterium]